MQIRLITAELTAAHLTEGDTRAVIGIDIGSDLKDKACEFGFFWLHIALFGLRRTGRGSDSFFGIAGMRRGEQVPGKDNERRMEPGRPLGPGCL